MSLFRQYFLQGIKGYFKPQNCNCNLKDNINQKQLSYDSTMVIGDFIKVYNKMTETKK